MPTIEVEGAGTFDVEEGKRLVLAIEEDAGVDILHRCGAYARCTTCRIEYLEGEPEKMTRAELEVLQSRNLLGEVRRALIKLTTSPRVAGMSSNRRRSRAPRLRGSERDRDLVL